MGSVKPERIRFWCEIATSVMTVAIGVLFLTQVADIYYSAADGQDIYSRAIVWGRLKYLIAPLCVWIAAIIACFVLSVIYPSAARPAKPASAAERAHRLRARIPHSGSEQFNAARKQYGTYELIRYIVYGVAAAFALGAAIYTVVYISTGANFASGEINTDVLALVRNTLPWIAASFLLFIGATLYEYFIAKRELSCMTRLLVLCKGMPISQSPLVMRLTFVREVIEKHEEKLILAVRIAVGVVAAVFIAIGAWNGGAQDVLYKAINICTECIGLG